MRDRPGTAALQGVQPIRIRRCRRPYERTVDHLRVRVERRIDLRVPVPNENSVRQRKLQRLGRRDRASWTREKRRVGTAKISVVALIRRPTSVSANMPRAARRQINNRRMRRTKRLGFRCSRSFMTASRHRQADARERAPRTVGRIHLVISIERSESGCQAAPVPVSCGRYHICRC